MRNGAEFEAIAMSGDEFGIIMAFKSTAEKLGRERKSCDLYGSKLFVRDKTKNYISK